MIEIIVDGRAVCAESGQTLLDACLAAGVYIPHLCSHPDLRPVGVCGLCVVEVEGETEAVRSCITEVREGMHVATSSKNIDRLHFEAMKKILEEHPSDCDSCVKYLNCELQALKQYINSDEANAGSRLRNLPDNEANPIFSHNPGRCIRCGRCMRACHELRGVGVLHFKKSGAYTYVGIGSDVPAGDASPQPFTDLDESLLAFTGSGPDLLLADADCRFCGACAEACPTGAILDRHEFGQSKSRREALLPCASECPAGIDVPRYIRFAGAGDLPAAEAVVREKVPFPLALGHVCSRPCENVCRRGEVNEPISIRNLKCYAATGAAAEHPDGNPYVLEGFAKKRASGKRVAVVGSGPAGLSAAYYLSVLGHDAIVFEKEAEPGGMLRYGVPDYRLPEDVLRREIAAVANLAGFKIRTESRIDDIGALADDDYDAVLVAIGARKGSRIGIAGADGAGVFVNTDFLAAARRGDPLKTGESVLVLGGGNVAFDCGRVAKRGGAGKVSLAFLEPLDGMKASADEIEAALSEGIELIPSVSFVGIERDGDAVKGLLVRDVVSFEFGEDGRLSVEYAEGGERLIPADTIIFAAGQKPDIPEGFGLALAKNGFVEADVSSAKTDRDGVFACSDCVTGTDSVVSAIAHGRNAALKIDKYLGGRGRLEEVFAPGEQLKEILSINQYFLNPEFGKLPGFAALPRCASEKLSPEEAAEEASRCLRCDMRLKMTSVKFWSSY